MFFLGPGSIADSSIDAAIINSEPRCCILDGENNTQISEAGVRATSMRAFTGPSDCDNAMLQKGMTRTEHRMMKYQKHQLQLEEGV